MYCTYVTFHLAQPVSSKLPRLAQVLENVRKTTEDSGRDLIDDALQSLRQMDSNSFTNELSPSPSDTDLSFPTSPGERPSLPTQLGDSKLPVKRYDSASSVSTLGKTTSAKYQTVRSSVSTLISPEKGRPQHYRASVPNLSEPSGGDHTHPPWRLHKGSSHSHSASVDMGSSK